jgi:DNA-binding NtrC family response regulator
MGPLRLLVIDDEPDLLDLVVEMLQAAGHVVQGATDPAAVARALADPYDVIVTDFGIVGLPADALLARLGTAAPATPVVVMSGARVAPTRPPPRVVAVLRKPFVLAELVAVVERAGRA